MPFGNVNVDYKPCKSAAQLRSAADYMLGKQRKQIQSGTVKTAPDLYTALGCNRDNFANSIMVTRKINGKSYSRLKANEILAHKMSISFHPDDKVDYATAFKIAKEFAEKFIHSKGYEVLIAVHTDRDHVHAHFLISNCNMENGKSYRRSQRDLYEMSEYFGGQCLKHGFKKTVRENFYNHETPRLKETFEETQIKKRGAETFKDELREAIDNELADKKNKCFDDVIRSLWEDYNIECRVAGNTVSYRHPQYLDKNGKCVSVRGSKLGDMYTRKGIENEYSEKHAAGIGTGVHRAGTSADYGRVTAELERFVGGAAKLPSTNGGAGSGQVRNNIAPHDGQQALRNSRGLYGERKAEVDNNAERSAGVQGKRSGRRH